MLPFGLKIAWFILSLSGLLCCWTTLWAFGRVVRVQWASVLYCIGTTLIQGMLCLGVVYRMDTFSMPPLFCLLQSVFMTFGAFINIGVVLALSLATGMTVKKPKTWGDASRALQWRKIFTLPVVGIPLLGTTIHVTLCLSFHSVKPADSDIWCDSSSPVWVRLMGFSGIPLLLSIPLLYQSTRSYLRVKQTNLHLLRSLPDNPHVPPCIVTGPGASLSRKTTRLSLRDTLAIPVTLALSLSQRSSMNSLKKGRVSVSVISGKETLQQPGRSFAFRPQSPVISPLPLTSLSRPAVAMTCLRTKGDADGPRRASGVDVGARPQSRNSSRFSLPEGILHADDTSSHVSTFPTFADADSPVLGPGMKADGGGISEVPKRRPNSEAIRVSLVNNRDEDKTRPANCLKETVSSNIAIDLVSSESMSVADDESIDWAPTDVEAVTREEGESEEDCPRKDSFAMMPERTPTSLSFSPHGIYKKPKREPVWLAPAIWHVIIFQFTFVFIQFLAFVTTFADLVSNRRPPSPFGTQHIALLLVAWCPVFIFGSLPLVRRNLLPWRPFSLS